MSNDIYTEFTKAFDRTVCFRPNPEEEGAFQKPRGLYTAQNILNKNVVGAMGTTFVHSEQQVQAWAHFTAVFDGV